MAIFILRVLKAQCGSCKLMVGGGGGDATKEGEFTDVEEDMDEMNYS